MTKQAKLFGTAAMILWLAGCGGGGGSTGTVATGGDTVGEDAFSRMTSGTDTSATTGAVSGQVVDDSGAPADGATVTVTSAGRQEEASFSTLCNENGEYQIGNMEQGRYRLQFNQNGIGEGELEVDIAAGQVQREGDAQLRPRPGGAGQGDFQNGPVTDPGVILGQVTDLEGNPIPRAHLNIAGRAHAATGEQGFFAFPPLAAGSYVIGCRAQGYVGQEQTADVVVGEVTRILFELEPGEGADVPAPVTVGGTVTDAETEAPLEGVSVSLQNGRATVETGADGVFLFSDVRPGGLLLTARKDGYQPYHNVVAAPPGSEVRVQIRLAAELGDDEVGQLQVTVLDAESGEPIRGAGVGVDRHGPIFTDEQGQVILERVPVGPHNLRVGAPRYHAINDVVEIAAGETTSLTIELEPAGEDDFVVPPEGSQRPNSDVQTERPNRPGGGGPPQGGNPS